MLAGQALGHTGEPAAVGEPAHWDFACEQLAHDLGCDGHVALQAELAYVDQPVAAQVLPLLDDLESSAADGDDRTLLLYMHGLAVRICGHHAARASEFAIPDPQGVDLVR